MRWFREGLGQPLNSRWVMTLAWGLAYLIVLTSPSVFPFLRQLSQDLLLGGRPDILRVRVLTAFGTSLGTSQEVLSKLRSVPAMQTVAAYRLEVLDSDAGRLGVVGAGPGFGQALGQRVVLGRNLQAADYDEKVPSVVVISERVWQDKFGRDPRVTHRSLWIEGRSYEIAGVVGAEEVYRFAKTDAWIPMRESVLQPQLLDNHFEIVSRLRPGVSETVAHRQMNQLSKETWGTWRRGGSLRRYFETEPLFKAQYSAVWLRLALLAIPFIWVLLPGVGDWIEQTRRWRTLFNPWQYFGFLGVKVFFLSSLLLGLWVAAMPLYPLPVGDPMLDMIAETTVALAIMILARWSAQWTKDDQKIRCPICLQHLRMPIASGHLGSVLFDRPTDEFICPEGHGLLALQSPQLADEGEARWRKTDGMWEELTR